MPENAELCTVSFNSVAIPNVQSIDGPSYSQGTIESGDWMGSTVKTHRASGKAEPGEVTVSFVYDSSEAGHTGLMTALTAGTEADLVVTYSDASALNETWTCNCCVTNFELSAEDESDVSGEATFQLTTTPTIT